jgi:hypothetical protein
VKPPSSGEGANSQLLSSGIRTGSSSVNMVNEALRRSESAIAGVLRNENELINTNTEEMHLYVAETFVDGTRYRLASVYLDLFWVLSLKFDYSLMHFVVVLVSIIRILIY